MNNKVGVYVTMIDPVEGEIPKSDFVVSAEHIATGVNYVFGFNIGFSKNEAGGVEMTVDRIVQVVMGHVSSLTSNWAKERISVKDDNSFFVPELEPIIAPVIEEMLKLMNAGEVRDVPVQTETPAFPYTVALIDYDLTFLEQDQKVTDFADLPTTHISLVDTETGIITSQPIQLKLRQSDVHRDPAIVNRFSGRVLEKAIKELFGDNVEFHRQKERRERDGDPAVSHENTGAAFSSMIERGSVTSINDDTKHQLEIGGRNKYRLGLDLGHGVYCLVVIPKTPPTQAEEVTYSTPSVINGKTSFLGQTAYVAVKRVGHAGPFNGRNIDLDFLQAKIKEVFEAEVEGLLNMPFMHSVTFFPMLTNEEMELRRRKNEVKMVLRRPPHGF